MRIKKGDRVIIIKGKDKGKKGKIERVFPKTKKALIPTVNVYKKHLKKVDAQRPGGIIDVVKPIPISNVMLVCPKCSKKTKVGFQVSDGEKIRICKICQQKI